MPTFEKRSEMPVPRDALFAYHARPGALRRLVPPWETVRVVESSEHIRDSARVVLEMKIGPIWKRWTAEHFDYVEGRQFRDRQVSGPFASWTHTHRFEDGPTPGTSVLIDHVEYTVPLGALGAAVGGRFVRGELERMFAFRHARTRNDLVRHVRVAPMTIAVSGASGGIASNLIPFLTTAGHSVQRLVRDGSAGGDAIRWDATTGEVDREKLAACDALVHLAGKNIAVRWTDRAWREIESSRVDATRKLCETLAAMERRPRVLVCASAVGIYGDRGDEELTEASAPGTGRLADVCKAWEAATHPARDARIRVVNLRIGVVVSASSGAVAKLLLPTQIGMAGPLGDGRQWMPWVAMDDVIGAIDAAIRNDAWRGPINAVAGSVRQREFALALARVLHRPAIVPTPRAAVRAIFGEMSDILFASANVRPTLAERGFVPTFASLEDALRLELGRQRK